MGRWGGGEVGRWGEGWCTLKNVPSAITCKVGGVGENTRPRLPAVGESLTIRGRSTNGRAASPSKREDEGRHKSLSSTKS